MRREFLLGSILPSPPPFPPWGVKSTFEGSEMNSADVLGTGVTEYLSVKSSMLPLWKGAGVTDPTLQSMHACGEDDRDRDVVQCFSALLPHLTPERKVLGLLDFLGGSAAGSSSAH